MGYDKMEKDHKKASRKQHVFYKSLGFENISGLREEIMPINLLKANSKFDSIELD